MSDDDQITKLALLGATGALAGALYAASRTPAPPDAPSTARVSPDGLHVVPVPMFGTYSPTISNEWNPTRGHLGVDFMYARRDRADLASAYPPGSINGDRNFFMPDGIAALAVAAGALRFADWTARGWTTIVDHDDETSTYYTHLERLSVSRTTPSSSHLRVVAGQPIGIIGFDPVDAARLKHLHFELWLGRTRDRATNPAPYVARWRRARLLAGGDGLPTFTT
jgi:murein DD-endopeptidase MepM/ murein hydrolase activator NlpD